MAKARSRLLPWPASALRERLDSIAAALGETRNHVVHGRAEAAAAIQRLEERLTASEEAGAADLARVMSALQVVADDEPRQRGALAELRSDPAYEQAYSEEEPLVSIVIPTFDNHRLLCERAIPSALAQTYDRIEVVIVGDGAPAVTRRSVEGVGDARVSFHNLPYRGPYPDDPQRRWLVAGVPPYNEAVRRAAGRWIAPLDDDDAFFPDHVERLLRHAREQRAELAYGAIREHFPGGGVRRLGCFPPVHAQFNLQAAIYHSGLAGAFELELADVEWELPYDWSLCRRMLRAGVRMSMLDEEVVHYYPSRRWLDERRQELAPEDSAEWELAEQGWSAARVAERQSGQGWDVAAVADSYARKWPEFLEAIDGPRALGVGHEVPNGVPMRRDDPLAQNTILAFGHVLARAARHKDSISVLDWGGALGHYYELGRRLLDDVALDYHCRELPAVCEEGRRVSPDVEFHDTDDCLERSYDLVMASGSLQYEDDWADLLRRLAEAATPWLFVTRLPVARRHSTFVIRQRAHAYGYETEYVGWVVNRDELVAHARDVGL